jgi:metal-responsive CopG/Arc/MetJ family transcriptional regulator
MDTFQIMLVKVNHRVQKVPEMQEVLTKYGCSIKMRLGLHEAGDVCSNQGLIILQLAGDEEEIKKFEKELGSVEGISVKLVGI